MCDPGAIRVQHEEQHQTRLKKARSVLARDTAIGTRRSSTSCQPQVPDSDVFNGLLEERWQMFYRRVLCSIVAGIVVGLSPVSGQAGQNAPRYEYSVAVQEITQLYWLAETANSCGWATRQEADEFEAFAVRFLAAHLSGSYRAALFSMISEAGFQPAVQRVALENRPRNCDQARWRDGWTSFKAAADENAGRY